VENAARELGYQPNALARRLRTSRADAVGLLMPSLASAYTRELFAGFEHAVRAAGLHAVLVAGSDPVATAIRFVAEGRIDGLLAPAFALRGTERKRLAESGTPHVITHLEVDAGYGPAVALDSARGIESAVNHLAETGRSRLLWAGLENADSDSEHRSAAFFRACKAQAVGFQCIQVGCGDPSLANRIRAACDAILPALHSSNRPDGIVAYHDPIALGALMASRRAGLRIPQDLSVIGFDDSYGEVADPPLSSISPRPSEMAEAAVAILLDCLKSRTGSEFQGRPVVIEPELILRASTRQQPK